MRERSFINLVVLVLVGLVISGGLYYFRDSIAAPFSKTQSDIAALQSPGPTPAPAPKARRTVRKEPLVEENAPPPSQAQARQRALPSITDVPADTPFPEVVERFGQPDLMATWSYDGKLNRKLIYSGKTASLEIIVQNGYVVSARD
jgi:hypothetical protein